MLKSVFNKILAVAVVFTAGISAFAQSGAYTGYSPYTVFALGDIMTQGSAYNKGMGGVGIATRNRRFINYLNPASITARDTLSFMVDASLYQNNRIYNQNGNKSANNTFNLNDLAMSFPIYKTSAVMLGIAPYSSTGFSYGSYETDRGIIGQLGNVYSAATYKGTISQMFAAAGVTFWRRLSIGIQGIYYFGGIDKTFAQVFSNEELASMNSGYDININGFTGKFGLQYEQPLGSLTLGVGAVYTLPANMNGTVDYNRSATSTSTFEFDTYSDTLSNGALKFAGNLGLGISLRGGENWRAEVNYTRSDWSNTGIENYIGFAAHARNVNFSATTSQSIRAGFEIIPNMNDIRYYLKRCAYRAGFYYEDSYFLFNGQKVKTFGVTVGATLPVLGLTNGLSIGVELGQRGAADSNMVRERFVNFTIGLNAYDIWFRKHQYQ